MEGLLVDAVSQDLLVTSAGCGLKTFSRWIRALFIHWILLAVSGRRFQQKISAATCVLRGNTHQVQVLLLVSHAQSEPIRWWAVLLVTSVRQEPSLILKMHFSQTEQRNSFSI